jgi:hypothetical protein
VAEPAIPPDVRAALRRSVAALLEYLAVTDPPRPADIIWALGSNELGVARRAISLFQGGLAPWVVFSGGRGHRWPNLPQSEAELFAAEARSAGVPARAVLVETRSTNTGENVRFSAKLFADRGLDVRSALLVTIPPFQRRAFLTARTRLPAVDCVNAPMSWADEPAWPDERLLEIASLCAGEIHRLTDYPRLGFIDQDPDGLPAAIREQAGELTRLLGPLGRTPA